MDQEGVRMKGLAVFFPGVGYHVDKPLLYYSRKIAAQLGYETADVTIRRLRGRG